MRSTNDRYRSEEDRLDKQQNRHRRRCQGNKIEKVKTEGMQRSTSDQKNREEDYEKNTADETQEVR